MHDACCLRRAARRQARIAIGMVILFIFAALCPLAAHAKRYVYPSYGQHVSTMEQLAKDFPAYLELDTAQNRYGLATVGSCPGTPRDQCLQHILIMTNRETLEAEKPRVRRPQIFISGTLHGNELVGPTATVAAAEYMLTHSTDPWIRHLLDTRITVILPFANTEGFAHSRREENGIDPNRDFGFDVDPGKCMQTMAARAMNEIFREHIFSMSITFHGGANVIAYQWGDTRHCTGYPRNCHGGYISSDHEMMKSVGEAMSRFASKSPTEGRYAAGPCNDPKIIYPVHGGMEDWAYGASWHRSKVTCTPTTHGGYPADKTKYNNISYRMPNFLVEASTRKKPPPSELGSDEDVLNPGGTGDGHVSRNIRLMLVGIDVLAPYIIIATASVDGAKLKNVGGKPSGKLSGGQKVTVSWKVGGCFSIDSADVRAQIVDAQGKKVGGALGLAASTTQAGPCYWSALQGENGQPGGAWAGDSTAQRYTTPFTATVIIPEVDGSGHRVVISVHIETDKKWQDASKAEGDSPHTPQTHMVRQRYDPGWYGRNGPYELVGGRGLSQTVATFDYQAGGCDDACQAAARAAAQAAPENHAPTPSFEQIPRAEGLRGLGTSSWGALPAAASAHGTGFLVVSFVGLALAMWQLSTSGRLCGHRILTVCN